MMAHKQLLHELLREDQEPFHLKSYIADKRSQLNNSSPITTSKGKNRIHIAGETSIKRSNAGFLAFRNPPDVSKSPMIKSPGGGAFLHLPSKTAAVLAEAAMRIKKQQRSKRKNQIQIVGFSLFGSFLKILKHRSTSKVLRNYETKEKGKLQEEIRISCSRGSNGHQEFDEINGGFAFREARFCSSTFRFSPRRSPPSSGRLMPEFCYPATSPFLNVKQEKENFATGEEEEEQCSPVSVLDPLFEEDEHESVDADEDGDYDRPCSYAKIERIRQQLLNRLRRFEELAALYPIDLEEKFLEHSDDEHQRESVESDNDNTSAVRHSLMKMSATMKRLVSDPIANDKIKVEFGIVDVMAEMDFKREVERWNFFPEEVDEAVEEVEQAIFRVLMEELSDELCYMDELEYEHDFVYEEEYM